MKSISLRTYLQKIIPLPTGFAVLVALASTASASVLTLDFANGNGTSSVDQYTGTTGSGWNTAWGVALGGSATGSPTVVNTTPLSGGGNYLSSSFTATSTLGVQVYRSFDGTASGVDITQDHSYSFNLRLDSFSSGQFTIHNNIAGQTGTGSADSWIIYTSPGGNWTLRNGNNAGGITGDVDSGILATTGIVYSFNITVNETTNKWAATISNGTTSFSSSSPLGFRTSAANDGTYLEFGGINVSNGTTLAFSLDALTVTSIPEPASFALIAGALLGLVVVTKRESR